MFVIGTPCVMFYMYYNTLSQTDFAPPIYPTVEEYRDNRA